MTKSKPEPEASNDEVERVARAICTSWGINPDTIEYEGDIEEAHLTRSWQKWEEFEHAAKVAIAAMKPIAADESTILCIDNALRRVWGVGDKTRPKIIEAIRPYLRDTKPVSSWQPIETIPNHDYVWIWNGGGIYYSCKQYLNTMQGVFEAKLWHHAELPPSPAQESRGEEQ